HTNMNPPYHKTIKCISGAVILVVSLIILGCGSSDQHSMEVTATAYTLRPKETKNHHIGLAAWGDQLKPGMKAIAVSRDLIQLRLTHNTKVNSEGLPGTYRVLDKMNKRWSKKIDILMGNNVSKAKKWGRRKVTIYWSTDKK